jgi:hypothetical protein
MTNVHVTGERRRDAVTASVDSFLANLPEMLGAMKVDPRCLVAVIEFEDRRYVQFWVTSDGVVFGEVVSNVNIHRAVALTSEQEDMLRAIGWQEPLPRPKANWRYMAVDVAELIQLVAMTREAVVRVLLETKSRAVSMRTWSMGQPYDRPLKEHLVVGCVYCLESVHAKESCLHEA